MSKPKSLLANGKALTEKASSVVGSRHAIPNGHSQSNVLRLVGVSNRLKQRVQRLCDGTRVEPEVAESVKDLTEDIGVAALCRVFPCFLEECGGLVLQVAHASEVVHDLG